MYYTPIESGTPYISCSGNNYPSLSNNLPPESDKALPSNPLLEDKAENKGKQIHFDKTG